MVDIYTEMSDENEKKENTKYKVFNALSKTNFNITSTITTFNITKHYHSYKWPVLKPYI